MTETATLPPVQSLPKRRGRPPKSAPIMARPPVPVVSGTANQTIQVQAGPAPKKRGRPRKAAAPVATPTPTVKPKAPAKPKAKPVRKVTAKPKAIAPVTSPAPVVARKPPRASDFVARLHSQSVKVQNLESSLYDERDKLWDLIKEAQKAQVPVGEIAEATGYTRARVYQVTGRIGMGRKYHGGSR